MPPRERAGRSKATKEPAVYGLAGWCVRGWLGLFGRPVRVLGSDRLPESAAIIHVCHDTSFPDALVFTAASPRPLTFFLARRHLSGVQSLLASSLGMVCYDSEASRWHAALRTCTRVLASGGLVAEFQDAEPLEANADHGASLTLPLQAWSSAFPDTSPAVLPAHRFRPTGRDQEILIHFAEALSKDDLSAGEAGLVAQDPRGENVFVLDPPILSRLLRDCEQALRDQLREEWAKGSARKQQVDGFRLSPGAGRTLCEMNRAEPESLLELRQLLEAEREARRQCSLAQLRAQRGRRELSAIRRALTWIETALGLPIALYGAVNHAVAGAFVAGFNLLRRGKPAQAGTWGLRALLVLACYTGQIVLVDHLMGRAAAGYYAVALPLSGAYLWRYWWLLRRRTRILLFGARAATLQAVAEKNRKRSLGRLRAILDGGVKPPPVRPRQQKAPGAS